MLLGYSVVYIWGNRGQHVFRIENRALFHKKSALLLRKNTNSNTSTNVTCEEQLRFAQKLLVASSSVLSITGCDVSYMAFPRVIIRRVAGGRIETDRSFLVPHTEDWNI